MIGRVSLVALLLSALTTPTFAASYIEEFTSNLKKDVGNTTADWNTAAGEIRLFPFTATLVGAFDTPGAAGGVAVDGDFAYVGDGTAGLKIFNIANPAGPTLLGTFDTSGTAGDIVVSGDLLYMADGNGGLRIFNVANPAAPVLLGTHPSPIITIGLAVVGDLAFLASWTAGLQIVNVSNPAAPVLVATYDTPATAWDVAVAGNRAFVADYFGGIVILDISNPASPSLVGTYATPAGALGIAVDGNHLYVTEESFGLRILNITNTASPTLVGSYDSPGNCNDVAVSGNMVVLADGTAGLHVLNAANPAAPVLMGTHDTPGTAQNVVLDDGLAFIADDASGFRIVRASHPCDPTLTGSMLTVGLTYQVTVDGDFAFVASWESGLGIWNVANPSAPTLASFSSMPDGTFGVAVDGDFAFVALDGTGLRIMNITNPALPVVVSTFNTPGAARKVAVTGDLAFVADGNPGLQILNITNPAAPSLLGNYDTPGMATDVAVAGDLAFVVDGDLRIVNVANTALPSLAGSYVTPGFAAAVATAGDLVFIADGSSGVEIVSVANPASPVLVGTYASLVATDVAVTGNRLLVTEGGTGLRILDITNPASPVSVGAYDTPGNAWGVGLSGDLAFVADGSSAPLIFRISQNELNDAADIGRSLSVDNAVDPILKARVLSNQTSNVLWELTANGGTNFQPITPGSTWTTITVPGADLRWRTTHKWATPGVNPKVTQATFGWLTAAAQIDAVSDVPNDQGKQVRLTWTRSSHDFASDPQQVTSYAIYRQIDPNLSQPNAGVSDAIQQLSGIDRDHAEMMLVAGWDYLTTVPVLQGDEYSTVVPTLADSTIQGGPYLSTFQVTGLTASPSTFFTSQAASGSSQDNLAPGVPQNFAASHNIGGINLTWNLSPEIDFQYFRVYRSTNPAFVPGPATLVHETAGTSWHDTPPNPQSVFYKLTALDFSGNASQPASSGPVSAVLDIAPAAFRLHAALPSPFRSSTRIFFELPTTADVSLEVFDVSGRRVTRLSAGTRPAGVHHVTWDGQDENGRTVAAGVYLYRLRAGSFESTQRVVLSR